MLGLYNSVRFLPHMVYSDQLIIRFGYQSSVELDIRNIENIQIAKDKGGIGGRIPNKPTMLC